MLDPKQMNRNEIYEKIEELRPMLDEMISDYFQLHCAAARYEGECLPESIHMTEFMAVCAWQSFNEHGQRGGDVRLLLRDGSMPLYVARGILSSALEQVNRIPVCCCSHVVEEDEEDGSA